MPLYKRSAFALSEVPEDIKPDEDVFQVRFTKEIFRNYDEYIKRINLYRQKVWACKVTGKINLTYEEALLSESKATEKVSHFPKEFMAPVLREVQFSEFRVSELVDRIYQKFKDHYVEDDIVESMRGGPCKILKVLKDEYDGDLCVYEVAWLKGDGQKSGTTTETGDQLTRRKHPLTKTLLKSFIRESAHCGVSRDSTWVVHEKLAREFNIPVAGGEKDDSKGKGKSKLHEMLENGGFNVHKRVKPKEGGNGNSNRRRDTSVMHMNSSGCIKRKRIKDSSESNSSNGSEYPIEDRLLQDSPDLKCPLPCSRFLLPMECIGSLLLVWEFCGSFSKVLRLSPFSIDDLENALTDTTEETSYCSMLDECHYALLQAALRDSKLHEKYKQKRKRKAQMTLDTLREDLPIFLELVGLKSYATAIRNGEYGELEAGDKLKILHDLVDRSVASSLIRNQIEESICAVAAVSKRRCEPCGGENKRKRTASVRKKVCLDELMDCGAPSTSDDITTTKAASGIDGEKTLRTYKRKKVAADKEVPVQREEDVVVVEVEIEQQEEEEEVVKEQEKQDMEGDEIEWCIRNSMLGEDRDYNRYWCFQREGRIYIESEDSKKWSFYSSKEELDGLLECLNSKGVRESGLKQKLERQYDVISEEMKKRMEKVGVRCLMYVNKYRNG